MPELARGNLLSELAFSGLVFGIAVLIALFVHPLLTRVAQGLAKRTETTLDDALVQAVGRPLVVFILVQGFFLALTVTTVLDRWQDIIQRLWVASVIAVIFYGLQRVAATLLRWYGEEVASKTRGQLDEKLLPLARRFLTVLIYSLGALLILDNLGISISPLLAGLGLGGLAVALALQPFLSNFIAGASVVADGSVGVGDFIEIQGGPQGEVTDIGWRSTKVRTSVGNLVIIPNSRVVDSIVTNYNSPTPEMNVFITCGVSYESDLGRVETVCKEVGWEVIRELPDAVVVKSFEPSVFFREFADSNINFMVVLRATNRVGTFTLQHEFIKRLHARFAQEGIEISYPVRKLVYPLRDSARTPPQS